MDTVRYWERKSHLNLAGHAVSRMLGVLGLGEWRKREVTLQTLERMRSRDKPVPAKRSASTGVLWQTNARGHMHQGVLENTDKPQVTARARVCGAKTRAGHPCKSRVIFASGRCKNHGGKATPSFCIAPRH
jgi:hypothetical protein